MRLLFFALLTFAFTSVSAIENYEMRGQPPTPDLGYNQYNLLLTVGMDEVLDQSAVEYGPTGFTTYLGWNQATIDTFRASAIQWFNDRFGIDFSGGFYDPTSGTVSITGAILVPLAFSGKYRVLSSNSPLIRDANPNNPAIVRLAEYVCVFTSAPTYGGTYVAQGSSSAGAVTDTLAFGCYRVTNKNGPVSGTYYDFFMRSYYPNKTDPASVYPARSSERFQMYSEVFGPGFGILNVAVPTTPNLAGKYPTFTRASWGFPTFVVDDWNLFDSSPIAP